MKGCGCAQRAEKVVGDDRTVVGFGDGGDFFAVGQATCQCNVWTHVLGTAVFEEFAELPYRGEALAVAQGYGDAFWRFLPGW